MSKGKARKSSYHGSRESLSKRREEKTLRAKRRKRSRLIRIVALVALVIAAGSGALHAYNRIEDQTRDLSAIGTGVPAVVQVHDITCPVCSELRSNVKSIEDEFSESDLLIRIADIRTDDGIAFARRYTTARRATLLFIDGDGELVDVQSGVQSEADLRLSFERHIAGSR